MTKYFVFSFDYVSFTYLPTVSYINNCYINLLYDETDNDYYCPDCDYYYICKYDVSGSYFVYTVYDRSIKLFELTKSLNNTCLTSFLSDQVFLFHYEELLKFFQSLTV